MVSAATVRVTSSNPSEHWEGTSAPEKNWMPDTAFNIKRAYNNNKKIRC
jgi:hypothetical protein